MEAASETAETEFFEYLNGRGLLQQLSETYPLKRKKQEVPMWLYVASDIVDNTENTGTTTIFY